MLEKPNKKLIQFDRSTPVIVFGGASTWEKEWNKFAPILHNAVGNKYYIAAVNNQIERIPDHVDFYFTLHTEKSDKWIDKRRENEYNMDFIYVGHKRRDNLKNPVDFEYRDTPDGGKGGSSGCYAPAVLIRHFGFNRIVLIGIPMTNVANAFRQERAWRHHHKYLKGWRRLHDTFKGNVKSTSGWTRERLGYPTEQWLKGEPMTEESSPFDHGEVLEQTQRKTIQSVGRDELDNLFEIPEILEPIEEFVLISRYSGKERVAKINSEYSNKAVYVNDGGVVLESWVDVPPKKKVREFLEGAVMNQPSVVRSNESKNERLVREWMEDEGQKLIANGNSTRTIISKFMAYHDLNSRYKEVVSYIGVEEYKKMNLKQVLIKALELN